MLTRGPLLRVIAFCITARPAIHSAVVHARTSVAPDLQTAEENAPHIFNAIHSAGRQWGSAIYHNGLSFIPAIMPEGTLLYHGAQTANRPAEPEWLAFGVEHAEAFAVSAKNGTRNFLGQDDSTSSAHDQAQKPMSGIKGELAENDARFPGYLHTYRANRDLNLLYVDGMSAAKTLMGTLDTQDLVLRENQTSESRPSFMGERGRVESICNLLAQWGYDGLMRMEIGFEVVYCDFEKGLDLVMQTRTSGSENPSVDVRDVSYRDLFQWTRAVSEQYDGIGGDRVRLDFSSMVSGYFFPVNISSTDPNRPDLHRLAAASLDELKDIKAYLRNVATKARRFTVHWQATVDMIVTRYARRLSLLAEAKQPLDLVKSELRVATQMYINAPARPEGISVQEESGHNQTAEALRLCRQHYLLPAYIHQNIWSLEDKLIHTAIQSVMSDICETLFSAYDIVHEDSANDTARLKQLNDSQNLVAALKKRLAWTMWRKPELCAVDEILLTVMWPLGSSEDYWHPGCHSYKEISFERRGYWEPDMFRI
ncbi:hypothetical protein EsDP_00005902 [Epichloe bromicola]|uniref:Uncharacterized protein n=1 Tax=Epichloe bromicola TaxID=79588 RepID=A0ABQ0CW24_9HYPO